MSIQDLGSIGELLAAIATIVTLVYLAVQIKQNTNAVAGATELAINKELTDWHSRVTSDPELMLLYEKGAGNEPMSEAEALRYRWFIAELVWYYEGVFRQHQRGLISDAQWETVVKIMLGLLESDVIKIWWEARTAPLSDEFVGYIDQRRGQGRQNRWKQQRVSVTGGGGEPSKSA